MAEISTEKVTKDLIIRTKENGLEIALLENGKLVELHNEKYNTQFLVGDVYLGKVKKVIPGLNAAFIDVGASKEGFLHYTDLGPQIRSFNKYVRMGLKDQHKTHLLDQFKLEKHIIKTGNMKEVFERGNNILVQVLKEPISTKGPRLTSEVTLPGRYVVMVPFTEGISLSRRIKKKEERNRLIRLVRSIQPKNFGVIVRTVAEGKNVAELHADISGLMERWEKIQKELPSSIPPEKIIGEIRKSNTLLRDFMNESFNRIVVDHPQTFEEVRDFVVSLEPEKKKIVQKYHGKRPIFDAFSINRQIKAAFGKSVNVSSGAYLVIESTEAMHVVDVNSGHKIGHRTDQEKNALAVNLESAKEIARQLRLRDLGGLVVIDFIDMKATENKKVLYRKMREFMQQDRAKHTILPLSRFGLMQITRQRVKPELKIKTGENCPSCQGTGVVKPVILIADELEKQVNNLIKSKPSPKFSLKVHPFLHAWATKGLYSKQAQWSWAIKRWINVVSDSSLSLGGYQFIDAENKVINIKKREQKSSLENAEKIKSENRN